MMSNKSVISVLTNHNFCACSEEFITIRSLAKEYKFNIEGDFTLYEQLSAMASEDYYRKDEYNDSQFFSYILNFIENEY